jgi:hypothetical protein
MPQEERRRPRPLDVITGYPIAKIKTILNVAKGVSGAFTTAGAAAAIPTDKGDFPCRWGTTYRPIKVSD